MALWRRANARNVRLYYSYCQNTDLFIFRFVTANRLQVGVVTDGKCGELIIRDLNDTKTKFDGWLANIFSAAVDFSKKDSVFLTLPLRKWLTTRKRKRKKITSNKHRPYWNMVETSMFPTLRRLWYFRKQQRNWKSLPTKVWYLSKLHLKNHVSNRGFQ